MRGIIMFHGLQPEPSALTITKDDFVSILEALDDNGYTVKPVDEVVAAEPADKVVALTFDDGFATVKDAAEVLVDRGAPATLFVVTGWVGKTNQWPGQPETTAAHRLMTWDDLASLKSVGWALEAHTHNHPDLRQLPDSHVHREIRTCKETLAARLGVESKLFAYPYGYVNRRVYDIVKTHFELAASTMLSEIPGACDPYLIPRIDAQYIWPKPIHFYFGRGRFRVYLQTRRLLRRWQNHPGEPVVADWLDGT